MTKPKQHPLRLDSQKRVVLTPVLVEYVLRLAYDKEGRGLLQSAIGRYYKAPDPRSLKTAIEWVRREWREPPQPRPGRSQSVWAGREIDVWIFFHRAFGEALLKDSTVLKKSVARDFVSRSARGSGFWHDGTQATGHAGSKRVPESATRLTSVALLNKLLKVAEGKLRGQREKTLKHYMPDKVYGALRDWQRKRGLTS